MNAEPLIPLPTQRSQEGLGLVQLLMLFLIWAGGITLGISAFLAELGVGTKAKKGKSRKSTADGQNIERNEEKNMIIESSKMLFEGNYGPSLRYGVREPKSKEVVAAIEIE